MLATGRHNKALLALLACLLAGGLVLYLYRSEALPTPCCLLLQLMGWQCPGCGSLRGIHALPHGDLGRVLQFNVMPLPALVYLTLLVILELLRPYRLQVECFCRRLVGYTACWVIFAIVVIQGIVRNLLQDSSSTL